MKKFKVKAYVGSGFNPYKMEFILTTANERTVTDQVYAKLQSVFPTFRIESIEPVEMSFV